MSLPSTHVDFIKKHRPLLVEAAKAKGLALLNAAGEPYAESFVGYDETFSDEVFETEFEIFLQSMAKESGFDIDEIRAQRPLIERVHALRIAVTKQTIQYEYPLLINYNISGEKTFYFGDNLAEHLAHTEVNLKSALIELPFPSCMFVYTSPAVVNAMHNINGDEGRLKMNTAGVDYTAPVSVFISLINEVRSISDKDFIANGRKLLITAFHSRLPDNSYLCVKRELFLGDDWDIERSLRTDWEKILPDGDCGVTTIRPDGNITESSDEVFYKDGLSFIRIIINSILYLISDNADVISQRSPRKDLIDSAMQQKSLPKRKKLLQKAKRFSELDYSHVGQSIGAIHFKQKDSSNEQAEPTTQNLNDNGLKLRRFMVRGHWRNQVFGEKRHDRKLIWIKPFYKGADIADVINKPYIVK